ncbi:MAG TPA: hypothetical protein VMB77_13900 [Syntrophales bacterium]|nr:hypothetical protein [Syntrophales bacterium]
MRGRRLSAAFGILVAVHLLTGFQTDALRANWKYVGGTLPGQEIGQTLAFYDSDNIQYLANGDVKVWVKVIDASEIDRLIGKDKKIIDKAADQVAKSYYPPYFLSNPDSSPDSDGYLEMITWEEAANHADIQPRAKLQYEIRCKEKVMQIVTAMTYKGDGTTTFSSDFDQWSSIDPGSAGAALRKLLCK